MTDDVVDLPLCGIIFEFEEMEDAEAFAAEVKSRWGLDSRVFDDAEAAARSHFPWEQYPPVVHVDRPWWGSAPDTKEWDEGWKVEREIEKLATKFGGGLHWDVRNNAGEALSNLEDDDGNDSERR